MNLLSFGYLISAQAVHIQSTWDWSMVNRIIKTEFPISKNWCQQRFLVSAVVNPEYNSKI